ncbi:hypothetical protein [Pseudonocardia sp.]|uniref:hypothetical protein n=1 Tax=Pseudonocardia sp. TaxID=60912 RepID=UPI0031FD8EDC
MPRWPSAQRYYWAPALVRAAVPAKMLKLLDALGLLGGKHGVSGPTNGSRAP